MASAFAKAALADAESIRETGMAQDTQTLDKLRDYLRQLPPGARTLLLSKFEKIPAEAPEGAIAQLVLKELRGVERADGSAAPRASDPSRAFFKFLDPFLFDRHKGQVSVGQIDRGSLTMIWRLIVSDLLPAEADAFELELGRAEQDGDWAGGEACVKRFQFRVADMLSAAASGKAGGEAVQRHAARLGPEFSDDLELIRLALKNRDAIEAFQAKLPAHIKNLSSDQVAAIHRAMDVPSLQNPQMLPLAYRLVLKRMYIPQQLVRFAVAAASSDDAMRVATTPHAITVTMVLAELESLTTSLRAGLKRGFGAELREQLKLIHDSIRGFRTEMEVRPDSAWGKKLGAIRADISSLLKSEIETVPGRICRLLRPPRDGVMSLPDEIDVGETAELIEFVSVCRDYANELAVNEVTMRTYSDVRQYLETGSNAIVERLRIAKSNEMTFFRVQMNAAIRFCAAMFGADYAATLSKAADVAMAAERKVRA